MIGETRDLIVVNREVNVITIKSNLGFDYEYMAAYIHMSTKRRTY